ARLTDEAKVQELLYGLSPESVYSRYHHLRTRYPRDEVQALLDADPQRGCAFVAELPEDGALIGLTRYDLDPVSGVGELGIVIADAWQRKGVGSALMRRMVEVEFRFQEHPPPSPVAASPAPPTEPPAVSRPERPRPER